MTGNEKKVHTLSTDSEKIENETSSAIQDLFKTLEKLPFGSSNRDKKLRPTIIAQLTSQLLNDSERARFLGLPETTRIREGTKIISPENLIMGEYCWIGEGSVLDASGGLSIGNHTTIGLGVNIWTHSSYLANLTMANYSQSELNFRSSTFIGDGVFISGPVVVMPGVSIGSKSFIRPFSVIDGDIPERSYVDGKTIKPGFFTDALIQGLIKREQNKN